MEILIQLEIRMATFSTTSSGRLSARHENNSLWSYKCQDCDGSWKKMLGEQTSIQKPSVENCKHLEIKALKQWKCTCIPVFGRNNIATALPTYLFIKFLDIKRKFPDKFPEFSLNNSGAFMPYKGKINAKNTIKARSKISTCNLVDLNTTSLLWNDDRRNQTICLTPFQSMWWF